MSGTATTLMGGISVFSWGDMTDLEPKSYSYNKSTEEEKIIKITDISLDNINISKKSKFLSFAGIWKNVDTETIKKNIYEARKKTTRTVNV